jgi:hypothetical protein
VTETPSVGPRVLSAPPAQASVLPFLSRRVEPTRQRAASTANHCSCGRRISANKEMCAACIIASRAPESLIEHLEAHPEQFVTR